MATKNLDGFDDIMHVSSIFNVTIGILEKVQLRVCATSKLPFIAPRQTRSYKLRMLDAAADTSNVRVVTETDATPDVIAAAERMLLLLMQ
jgi:hypothetical protein